MLDDALITEEQPKPKKSGEQVSLLEYSKTAPFSFNAENYKLLFIGLAINVLGYILMMGGGSDDPTKFDGDALFSATRITVAPALIVLGFVVMGYSIMKRPKSE